MSRAALVPQVMLSWCHCRLAVAMKVEASPEAGIPGAPPEHIEALFSGTTL